jgi:hypothetical protein
MRGSSPSEVTEATHPQQEGTPAAPSRAFDWSDAIALVGVASTAVGAALFHPGAGLVVFGLALIFVATRGA